MQVLSAAEAATRRIALAACVELVPFPVCLDVGDARLVFVQRWFLSSLRDWVLSAAVTQRLRAGLHYAAVLRLRSGGAGRGWRRVLWGIRHSTLFRLFFRNRRRVPLLQNLHRRRRAPLGLAPSSR